MRLIQNTAGWLSIDSAPVDEDVTLLVVDGGAHVAQRHRLDRFVEAPGIRGL
jgi:hypothetical protein